MILLLSALLAPPTTTLSPAVLILSFHTVLFQQAHAWPACRNTQTLASESMHLLQRPACGTRSAMQKTGKPVYSVLRQLSRSRVAPIENQSRVRINCNVEASSSKRLASTCPYQTVAGAKPFQMLCATCTCVSCIELSANCLPCSAVHSCKICIICRGEHDLIVWQHSSVRMCTCLSESRLHVVAWVQRPLPTKRMMHFFPWPSEPLKLKLFNRCLHLGQK